jgi:gliding motility-associated lipoprotein GldK
MRRILVVFAFISYVLSGCGMFGDKTGKGGELTGVTNRPKWDQPNPYGMVLIPPGSFHMGQNDQDVNSSQIAHNRQVTISAFYMDDTEISNNEYRQFVNYMITGQAASENVNDPAGNQLTVEDSMIKFLKQYYDYTVSAQDLQKLIYPDTLVWIRDFSYSYNEPLTENYYWHPAFDNYPVVGINWYGAQAFCIWRTIRYNNYRDSQKKPKLPRFRLPTEAEWEYAARGGFEHKIYPWEGPYIRNSKGCFLANFKPGRGDYIADNFEYTCPIKSYWPNDYGLYCMPGNVAEWCEDDFEETGYSYAHDLNPIYRDPKHLERRRVIRGGSWKDVAYFLSVGTRTYEYADTTKSFIGFRCVVTLIGRSGAANIK